MIPIKYFCEDDVQQEKEIKDKFCEINLKGRKRLSDLDSWCKRHLPQKDDGTRYTFRDVVVASPQTLVSLKKHLDSLPDKEQITDELYTISNGKRISCYIIDNLYTHMEKEAKQFLIDSLDIKVCPYCNRNYVYSYRSGHTCQLDHFFNKADYPIFAASFYNLIPVCGVCNHKKKTAEFEFYPHLGDYRDTLRFTYMIKDVDFIKNKDHLEIDIIDEKGLFEKQLESLALKDIYQGHKDIVVDIAKKHKLFSRAYIEALSKEFVGFVTPDEVRQLIYGVPLSEDEVGNRPLSKLTQDLLEEMDS